VSEAGIEVASESQVAPDPHRTILGARARCAAVALLRAHWPVLVPLFLFAVSALIVPTMADVATTDDWAYSRSVEILYREGELVMFPVVAATAVGQVLWGGAFALLFGMTLGVMRLSTVAAVAIGSIALYAILRQLGVSRSRSSLGTALYLFNPLSFTLSYTFMTDPHFASWMLVSVALYLRGLGGEARRPRWIVAGSICAGYAFWIRQQGALIPVGVVMALIATRQVWLNWRSVKLLLQVALAPVVMLVAYYGWLYWFNDVPDVQQGFLDRAVEEGWSGTSFLIRRVPIFAAMYLGLFLLPLVVALVPSGKRRSQAAFATARGYLAFLGMLTLLVVGVIHLASIGRFMPYIPQFLGSGGFGPADVPGGRRRLVEWDSMWMALTAGGLLGAVLLAYWLCGRIGSPHQGRSIGAAVVAMVAAWQLLGVIPPSYQYIARGGSLDRYLLPLIPLVIALMLWAIRDVTIVQPVTWLGVACFAVISVAGTRDYLVYLHSVWEMAEYANEAGLPNEKIDAGSGWDGYHLYTDMIEQGVTKTVSPRGSPWWVYFYAKQTDSTYMVTTNPRWRSGYVVVERREYDQWIEDDPVYIYLVRKSDQPWPPVAK
jgi:4-amino-4-deoxy-L-arabinose transferase-like glycosyltransferase